MGYVAQWAESSHRVFILTPYRHLEAPERYPRLDASQKYRCDSQLFFSIAV
jgi:hypothetical protein